MVGRPISMAEQLDAEDAKLVVLARAAMARAEADSSAAVRDVDGRTYAAAPMDLTTLKLTGLLAVVAAAASSGATGVESAALVAASADDPRDRRRSRTVADGGHHPDRRRPERVMTPNVHPARKNRPKIALCAPPATGAHD